MLDWAPKAIDDLKEIVNYILPFDPDIADYVQEAIYDRAEWIVNNFPMAGGRVEGLGPQYRQNYAIRDKYRIIYKVLGDRSIKIIMVRHTKRRPTSASEIREQDQ